MIRSLLAVVFLTSSFAWAGPPPKKTEPAKKAEPAKKGEPAKKADDKAAPAAPASKEVKPSAAKAVSYEELISGAASPNDMAMALEPLFAECGKESDLAYRQCQTIKEWNVERIRHTRYVVSGDGTALSSSPWDESEKNVTLTVTGCVSCSKPPRLGGVPRLLATKAPKGFAEGAPIGLDLGFHEVSIEDQKKAKRFSSLILPRLRVEYVFTVGDPFDAGAGEKAVHGVAIVPLGHRVYNNCTGEVVASEPVSSKPKQVSRDATCAELDAPTEEEMAERADQAALPDEPSRGDIERTMASVKPALEECASVFELKGTMRVTFNLAGDGLSSPMKILPPFDKGEAAVCLRSALKKASFPRFKRGKVVPVEYPFVLHP